jgi:hypothetical protein
MVAIHCGLDGDLALDELLHFPAGKYDDEVDTASLIGRALDETHPAIVKREVKSTNPPDLSRWRQQSNAGGAFRGF